MILGLLLVGCVTQPPPSAQPAPAPAALPEPTGPAAPWSPDSCTAPLPPDQAWTPIPSGALKAQWTAIDDLDADGSPERFEVRQEAGDGFAVSTLTLSPTKAEPIAVQVTFSYNEMVHRIPVPAALQGPERAAWRVPFEAELLRLRCDRPDPGLAWLEREPRRFEWIAGDPTMPTFYGRYDPQTETWTTVSGHTHTMPEAVGGGTWPIEDGTDGEQTLLRTAHGVILHDRSVPAWTWVHLASSGLGRLKWQTLEGARFDGDRVVVTRLATDGRESLSFRYDRAGGVQIQ